MYFTQTSIRNNELVTMSEYISTRLIRKGEISSYYVGRCLTHVAKPTVVNQICFIKQTIIKQPYNDPFYVVDGESKIDQYRKLYNNQIMVHQYVEREVNYPSQYYSKLYDYWHDVEGLNHRFTIVTKYQEFGDLNHFLEYVKDKKIQLDDIEVIYILNNMLRASLELYKIGVIHRDIKPENIFIDKFFKIKFGDFGISLLDEKDKNPQSNQRVGTYGFMAPEIFNQPYYSFSVDVWAIGVVVYYMMYLVYPYGREKEGYEKKVNGRLKDIEHASKYNDHFSKRLKEFMRRFFVKPAQFREKSIFLYEYEYMHQFRTLSMTLGFKKRYEEHMKKVNSCNTAEIQRFALQQHSLYHQKILQVVRYQQWGYFFFLSNLKVIGLFNSKADNKIIRIFPDCLDDVEDYKKDLYCTIISRIYKTHFHNFKMQLLSTKKVFTKRLNCTIANIVQYKGTLAVRLKLQLSKPSKKQLRQQEGDIKIPIPKQYQQWKPNSANKNPFDFYNNTLQLFFFPRQLESQFAKTKIKYTTYDSSIIFNNNMNKKDEVLISKINRGENNLEDYYQMKKYPDHVSVLYSDDLTHKSMINHAKKLFAFVATKKMENNPQSAPFLKRYKVNDS